MTTWQGWSIAGTVLYLHQAEDSEHVSLFMQYGQDSHQVGGFIDAVAAAEVQDWLGIALTA